MSLIERQKAIDEIMKELKDRSLHDDEETSEDFADGYDEGIRNAATRVYLMPSASTKPLIRCRNCKFWQDQEEGVVEVPICARPENKYEKLPFRFIIGEDGFCSFAERRTDGV